MAASIKRPLGVTIIGILNLIGGIFQVIGGLALITIGGLLAANPSLLGNAGADFARSNPLHVPIEILGVALLALGAVILPLGVLSFVIAYGTLKGKGWAWTLNVVVSIIGIIINIISTILYNSGIQSVVPVAISIGISVLILYYLYRPHVKQYFGKTLASAQPQS